LRLRRKVLKLARCYLLARETIMPGPAPKTDKWSARENKRKGHHVLRVSGLVEVTSTNKAPRLKEAHGGSKVLALDLDIATENVPGVDVLVWKPAAFHKRVQAHQYDKVTIRYDGKDIAGCPVVDDDEHHGHLLKITQAANTKHAGKKRPGAPAKKRAAGAKKKAAAAPKKRPAAAAKKSRSAAPKKRKSAAAKRRPAAAKKRVASAKKRASAPARRRAPASAKKRRTGRRR
jgi:hypothetical protein